MVVGWRVETELDVRGGAKTGEVKTVFGQWMLVGFRKCNEVSEGFASQVTSTGQVRVVWL